MRIFVWFNLRMTEREEAFSEDRKENAPPTDFYEIDESRKLHVFPQEE